MTNIRYVSHLTPEVNETNTPADKFNADQDTRYNEKRAEWLTQNPRPNKARVIDSNAQPKSYAPITLEGATRLFPGAPYFLPTHYIANEEYYIGWTPRFGCYMKSRRPGSIYNLTRQSGPRDALNNIVYDPMTATEYSSIIANKPKYKTLLNSFHVRDANPVMITTTIGGDGIAETRLLEDAFTAEIVNEPFTKIAMGRRTVTVCLDYNHATVIF
jgi:hypothetical protein